MWNDFNLNKEEKEILDEVKGKIRPSYTVSIKRKGYLYADFNLDDYIHLIECLKKADIEFAKNGLKLILDTIDNEMNFDIIEVDNVFKMTKDNIKVCDFLTKLTYNYRSNQGRSYVMVIDDRAFYRTYLMNGYNATNEASNIENVSHFQEFLNKECKKKGFKIVEVNNFKFNIYTKRQYRMLTIKEVLKW